MNEPGRRLLRRFGAFALAAVLLQCARPESFVRQEGESIAGFATRLLPPDSELASAPVELQCGPPGASVVVLFRPRGSQSNFTGWVLVPTGQPQHYRKVPLPLMDEMNGQFDISITRVHTTDAGNGKPELVVRYTYYRLGSGGNEGKGAYVYAWDGSAFHVEAEAGKRAAAGGPLSEAAALPQSRSRVRQSLPPAAIRAS
jgi:hypothetical protein